MTKKDIIETNKMYFGKLLAYKAGTVVAWRGHNVCIGRIKVDFDCSNSESHTQYCAIISDDSHNSLHYSHLRLATKKEIAFLGEENIII